MAVGKLVTTVLKSAGKTAKGAYKTRRLNAIKEADKKLKLAKIANKKAPSVKIGSPKKPLSSTQKKINDARVATGKKPVLNPKAPKAKQTRKQVSRDGFDNAKVKKDTLVVTKIKKAPAKKVAKKKVAKKAPVKKVAKKVPAKKVAKKAPVKKTPAKKAPVRKTPRNAGGTSERAGLSGGTSAREALKKSGKKNPIVVREETQLAIIPTSKPKPKPKRGKSSRQAGYEAGKKAFGRNVSRKAKRAGKKAKSILGGKTGTALIAGGAGYGGAKMGSSGGAKPAKATTSKFYTRAEMDRIYNKSYRIR